MASACTTINPAAWGDSLSGPPDLCSAATGAWSGALLRRWHGTDARMEQPPLNHHYLVLHLGGPKSVTRRSLHSVTSVDAEIGALTVVTAGTTYSWNTQGPIGFAHLYLHPHVVDHVIQEEFDRDSRSIQLIDCVAQRLPLLSAMMSGMLDQLEKPTCGSRLILDTLLNSLIVQLVAQCSTLSEQSALAPHSLSPRRLRRVLDFMESNLGSEIELDDLASVAGSSRFHFSRAFREATGFPPYRYLIHRRMDAAKTLLCEDALSISQIADQCGFNSQSQFSTMFRRVFGTSPARFRREH